jgi:hypothetical protein
MSLLRDAFQLSFQLSPIVLTNGIAENIPGGMLPIIALTEAANFVTGLLSGGEIESLDNFFAHYTPMAQATLIDNQVGTYPFANQNVAANAIIGQPLTISLKMICPVKSDFGYAAKLVTFMALQAALAKHNNSGGTYIIATPSYLYTNCLFLRMSDISSGESAQAQNAWQLDFFQPLLTQEQAQQAQSSLMKKISDGTKIDGNPSWSGLSSSVGSTSGLVAPSVVPAASGPIGAGAAPLRGSIFG